MTAHHEPPVTAGPGEDVDLTWREPALATREALELLGHYLPRCLPGEPEECGAGYAQHTAAQFGMLRFAVDEQINRVIDAYGPDAAGFIDSGYRQAATDTAAARAGRTHDHPEDPAPPRLEDPT